MPKGRQVSNVAKELARVMPFAKAHLRLGHCRTCVTLMDAVGHVTQSFSSTVHTRNRQGISSYCDRRSV